MTKIQCLVSGKYRSILLLSTKHNLFYDCLDGGDDCTTVVYLSYSDCTLTTWHLSQHWVLSRAGFIVTQQYCHSISCSSLLRQCSCQAVTRDKKFYVNLTTESILVITTAHQMTPHTGCLEIHSVSRYQVCIKWITKMSNKLVSTFNILTIKD